LEPYIKDTTAVVETLAQIDVIHRLQAAYPDIFSPSTLDSAAAVAAFRKHGRLLGPIGVEGLHMIGRNASILRLYHSLGARYTTLTWNCHNAFADAAQVAKPDAITSPDSPDGYQAAAPYWGGLSPLGTKLVHEMNRIGIMVRHFGLLTGLY
jgi:membrane dipeptidase